MPTRIGTIVRLTGRLLLAPAAMALVTLPFCLVEGDLVALAAFGALIGICLALAGLARLVPQRQEADAADAVAAVALAWLLIGGLCGVPLAVLARAAPAGSELALAYGPAVNALFEGMSGITSCGLTVAARPDLLPASIQWWRSLCEWVGGVGVVVTMLLLLDPAEHADAFYRAEARTWRLDAPIRRTAVRIWSIFLALSAFSVLALKLAGETWWVAVNHGLTGIATGGFSIRADSFQGTPAAVQGVTMAIMVLGAISFRTYSRLVERERRWWRSTQLRWLGGLLAGGFLVLLGLRSLTALDATALQIGFQWVSALGTCGFASADLEGWSPAGLVLLMVGMVVGGMAGSTTGGIKVSRLVWLCKSAGRHLRRRLDERKEPAGYRFDGTEVDAKQARRRIRHAAVLAGLWIATLAGGWLVLLVVVPDHPPLHLLFEAASALGSVGLTTGATSAALPTAAKATLIVLMWLGRLEIISALLLVLLPWSVFRIPSRGRV
ncbi:MAG: potassium transporter TrkG [Candidatus Krumholzibacteriia bacterium]